MYIYTYMYMYMYAIEHTLWSLISVDAYTPGSEHAGCRFSNPFKLSSF